MNRTTICKICKEKIDKTSVDTFVIITIKAIDEPRRFYFCEDCEINFQIWIYQNQERVRKEKEQ